MYVCKNCGMTYSHQAKFCERCGSAVVDTNYSDPFSSPAYSTQSRNTDAIFSTPTYSNKPLLTSSGAGKALGIVGMSLGIFNIAMSLFTFIASIAAIGLSEDYDYSYYYGYRHNYHTDEISSIFVFVLMMLILSIVGLVLSSVSRGKGFVSGISKTGKILGILSTVFNGISFVLAMIALANVA